MTTQRKRRRDPMDSVIESALQPGRFVGWREGSSFVGDLCSVEREIAKVVTADPARAASLYETFIAACTLKAEEIDDSDGEMGAFAGSLYCGWIKARQAARADPGDTVRLLFAWMKSDDYGFCNDLERAAVKVLDRAGLASFEAEANARFEMACTAAGKGENRLRNYECDRWGRMLRSIYSEQRNAEKYLDLTARTGLSQLDCEAMATMLKAKRKPVDALAWLERGIRMDKGGAFESGSGYRLAEMRRALLVKLGRGNEALDSAWAEFEAHPCGFTYEELIRYVPKAGRAAWHEKAMASTGRGDLASLIDLWLKVKEVARLAERLDCVPDSELEGLSHYATEPAAQRLAKTYPAVAAKVYRALCIRVLNAGKSKYYYAALSNLEEARRCYQLAGSDAQWKALVDEIRRDHRRKSGFMPGFELIVAGRRPRVEPSFLERARGNWARKALE